MCMENIRPGILRWSEFIFKLNKWRARPQNCAECMRALVDQVFSWPMHPENLGRTWTMAYHHVGYQDQLPSLYCVLIPKQRFWFIDVVTIFFEVSALGGVSCEPSHKWLANFTPINECLCWDIGNWSNYRAQGSWFNSDTGKVPCAARLAWHSFPLKRSSF